MATRSIATGGRSTVIRALPHLGLAAWFGGTLTGALGLNGGGATAKDGAEPLRVCSAGSPNGVAPPDDDDLPETTDEDDRPVDNPSG